ncbi:hypothetical protein Leryth_017075 [Lithospermum erythrorhizon]|nr:hypothetical protein Leryth_017075 [Lithospermum erythrorhizon]
MAHLFSAEDGDGGATSITSLLGSADTDGGAFSNFTPDSQNVRTGPAALVRTALRNYRGREESEERWVSYSELVEKRTYEEVSSCYDFVVNYQKQKRNNINDNIINNISPKSNSLALKLDYNEIMDAWSDRGPLYIHGESSLQIVPDHILLVNHDTPSNGLQDESGANDTWRVPELVSNGNSSSVTQDKVEAVGEEYHWKIEGQRQASIRRYKEKRQNRLFAKRIRYQVRKLNAEKRPRVKGRFVKRS